MDFYPPQFNLADPPIPPTSRVRPTPRTIGIATYLPFLRPPPVHYAWPAQHKAPFGGYAESCATGHPVGDGREQPLEREHYAKTYRPAHIGDHATLALGGEHQFTINL